MLIRPTGLTFVKIFFCILPMAAWLERLISAFSNLCVYGECFDRLRVDGRPKRIKKFAFTIVCIYNRLRVDGASGCRFNKCRRI